MFGKKVQISLNLCQPMVKDIEKQLEEANLDLETAINLFLYSSLTRGSLAYDQDLVGDFFANKDQVAREFLVKELDLGRNSYREPEISQADVLMFLGVY
ncbi:MAG: hypothetical protein Q4E36_00220 [Bacillota bacterium]|nr:hypothetical protein [Bacillota bacterium]